MHIFVHSGLISPTLNNCTDFSSTKPINGIEAIWRLDVVVLYISTSWIIHNSMSLYIFDILLYYYICLCTTFLLPLRFGWLLVPGLHRRIIYKFLNVCPFDYTSVAVSGKVERS